MTAECYSTLIVDGPHAGQTVKTLAGAYAWMLPNPFKPLISFYAEPEDLLKLSIPDATSYRLKFLQLWIRGEELPRLMRVGWSEATPNPDPWSVLRWSGLLWLDAT